MFLKIKEERNAAEQTLLAIAKKYRRTPLRSAQRARFSAARVGELLERRHQFNRARVIKTCEGLDQRSPCVARRGDHVAQATAARIDVRAIVSEQMLGRAITNIYVQRRESSRYRAIA